MPSDDEVEVVVPWDIPLKQSPIYISALEIFSGKAHEAPPIDKKKTMLLNIVNFTSEEYFLRGSQQAKDFELLKKQCFANWTSVSARARVWTVPYTAEKLALLLVLRNQVDSAKKVRASPRAGATPQMTDLKRAMRNLSGSYDNSLTSYTEMKQAEANKSVRLPSLDRQLTGPLQQYDYTWSKRKRDEDGCPCCLHMSTMAIESQSDVNAKNRELRAKTSAGGGDGKFVAASALHGCYCSLNNCRGHQGGYGCFECIRKAENGKVLVDRGPGVCGFDCVICDCNCRCVFMEHNRQKISTGVVREKKRLEEAKKSGRTSGGDASPKECGRTAWTEYIFSVIENRNVWEHQHVDNRSTSELHQDCRTLAAIDAFLDPTMASDANVGRGLKTVIPLSRTMHNCAVDGMTRPMTFARAMAAKKRRGEVVSIADNTPPAINFLRNSDTSNRVQRNHLVVPTAVAAAPTPAAAPPISMVKRVMKRAGDMFFSGPETTPTKRNCAGRVRTQLSRSDPEFTSILEDYEDEKNSQEIFEFCLAQTRLE
jgi:hypothetical protein